MLLHFLETEAFTNSVFRKYAGLYAAALGKQLESEADYQTLWESLSDLPSFSDKGPLVKLMRWYAWWYNFTFQEHQSPISCCAEFWAAKMVFEHHLQQDATEVDHADLGSVLDDTALTPEEQLRKLKAAQGGFKLAHTVMTADLYLHSKVLFRVGRPSWSYHVWRVDNLKTPAQGLAYDIEQAQGKWSDEVYAIVQATLGDMDNLSYWGVLLASSADAESEAVCRNAAQLGLYLANHRAWSSFLEYSIVPLAYAPILSPDIDIRQACALRIKTDWTLILDLERFALTNGECRDLRKALTWADYVPNRLFFMLFERGGYDPDFPIARDYARSLLECLPDSRVVEEHHERLRDLARDCKHNVTNRVARMQACRTAGILEARGMATVTVVRQQFVDEYRLPIEITRETFDSSRHKLDASWERLQQPGVRSWASPNPSASRQYAAAWHWAGCRAGRPASSAKASCIFPSFQLVRRTTDNEIFLCMETCRWGCMALQAAIVSDGLYRVDGDITTILHATAIDHQFIVIPTSVCSPGRLAVEYRHLIADSPRITFTRDGAECQMLHYMLTTSVRVTSCDLLFIAKAIEAPHRQSMTNKELVNAVARHYYRDLSDEGKDAAAAIAVAVIGVPAVDCGGPSADHLIDDDVEEIFDLLDQSNKDDFADFGKSIKEKHLRNKIRAARNLNDLVKAKARAKGAAKAKAKAKDPVVILPFAPPAPPTPVVVAPAPPTPVAVAPPAPPTPVAAPLSPPPPFAHPEPRPVVARGESWSWGPFKLGKRPPSQGKPLGSVWARCKFHDPEPSASGVALLECIKEWHIQEDVDADFLIRKVKWWCVSGEANHAERVLHMSLGRTSRQLFPGEPVPSNEQLDASRVAWDDLGRARRIVVE